MATFIDCTSVNLSYNVYGLATITYTVVSDIPGIHHFGIHSLHIGNKTFNGYIASASVKRIPNTSWYESNISFIGDTG
jgi:hypothetical protein